MIDHTNVNEKTTANFIKSYRKLNFTENKEKDKESSGKASCVMVTHALKS